VLDITDGKGVNVAVNVTGGGKTTVADSIAVAAKLRCTIVLAAAGQEEINVGSLGRAKIVLKRANGHSYFAVEQAIRLMASGKYPLSELCTPATAWRMSAWPSARWPATACRVVSTCLCFPGARSKPVCIK